VHSLTGSHGFSLRIESQFSERSSVIVGIAGRGRKAPLPAAAAPALQAHWLPRLESEKGDALPSWRKVKTMSPLPPRISITPP